jgi:hypothetical protein
VDLSVNQATGEVFISTSKGLISYRGQAIADDQYEPSLVIYPNPVPPGFTGLVGIKGLPDEAVVKITDVSGKLIYETRSEGGQAVWDTRNLQGNKVTTGVYLVFISNKDGEEGLSGKIAVIH